jgi:hypothetical protein
MRIGAALPPPRTAPPGLPLAAPDPSVWRHSRSERGGGWMSGVCVGLPTYKFVVAIGYLPTLTHVAQLAVYR